jgi:uncharacterized lipoprotein YmbA
MISPRWVLSLGLLLAAGCSSGPPQGVFVLSGAANPVPAVGSDAGRPVVRLKPVALPDYLDTTDIFLRDGQNQLKSSATGRWGERLSVGIARALSEDLTARMPGITVDQGEPVQPPSLTLLVDVAAFDIRPDGRCVLSARWTVVGRDNQTTLAGEHATIITTVPQTGGAMTDAAIVTAMADAVRQLADHVAVNLTRSLRVSAATARPANGS